MKPLLLACYLALALLLWPAGARALPLSVEPAAGARLAANHALPFSGGRALPARAVVLPARLEQHRGGGHGAMGAPARGRVAGPVVGHAGPRSVAPFGRRVFVGRPFAFSPFAFSAFGFGFDPFLWYGWGYPYGYWGYPYWGAPYWGYPYGSGYGYGYGYAPGYYSHGSMKLDVKPKNAEVYVDGYYVGQVEDFNGVFHHLDLREGTHKIEIRANGYQPLQFETRIMSGQTVTYRGTLSPGESAPPPK